MMAQQTSCTWPTACTTQNYPLGLRRHGCQNLSNLDLVTQCLSNFVYILSEIASTLWVLAWSCEAPQDTLHF